MSLRTRILGTRWSKYPDGLWRGGNDARRVANSLGGAAECESALRHAESLKLSAPCNEGHIWKDTGMRVSSATHEAEAFNLMPAKGE